MLKRNILMIAYTHYASDPRVIREAESAAKAGYNVDFLALRRKGDAQIELINGVNIIRLKVQKYRGNSNLRYVLSYLHFFINAFLKTNILYLKKKYSIVHINNMPDFFVFIALLPKLMRAKIILDIHDPMPSTYLTKYNGKEEDVKYKLLLWQELISAGFADKVLTVHEPVKNEVIVRHGIPEKKINVIANFTDEYMFPLNKDYRINEKLSIIFHGTISQRFGLDLVLKIFSRIECKDRYYIKIIGEGDYSKELERLISDLELKDYVDFENKSYPASKLQNVIKQFSMGLATYRLSPATDYMLPLKMLEYISTGLPVITVRNKAINYYFNEDDLFYIEPVEFNPLGKILEICLSDPSVLLKKRNRVLEIRDKFLWKNEERKYVNILESMSEVGFEKGKIWNYRLW